jgi:Tol biopolymer transport system component/DNA-binding winged helix-turn-helix (wHTH) protein
MPSRARSEKHSSPASTLSIRFDRFRVDVSSGQLRKEGRKIRLQPQPFQLLVLLLRNPGQVVSREDVRQELWAQDTFVDFDHGLAAAVNKLREALGDSAESPRYIETLPRRGYRFIGSAKCENVDSVAGEQTTGVPLSPDPSVEDPVGTGREISPRRERWLHFGLILAAVASLSTLIFVISRNRTSGEAARASAAVPFTSLPGFAGAPAFSPDGSRIAFAWNGDNKNTNTNAAGFDLYVKALGSEEKLQLTHHPSEWISSAWSPDGTQVAFHRMAGNDTGIYVVSAMGGPERRLVGTRIAYGVAAPISWSPDGKWIAFGNPLPDEPRDRMFRISVETAEIIPFEHDPECVHEAIPTFSRDGRKIFYSCVHTVYEGDLRSRPVQGGLATLIRATSGPPFGITVSGDDEAVGYSDSSGLWFVNLKDGSVSRITAPEGSSSPTISARDDKVAFTTALGSVSIRRRDLLHPGTPAVNLIPSSRQQNSAHYSPDGRHMVFDSMRSGDWAVWVSDLDGGNLFKVSKEIAGAEGPAWSPDGTKIVFDTALNHPSSVYVVDIAEGIPRKIRTQISDMKLPSWSHDGKSIYFISDFSSGHRVYRCKLQGGVAERLPTDVHATRPEESPDGQYLYTTSREANSQLEKLSLQDLESGVQIEPIPRLLNWTVWQVTPRGIYFVPQDAPRTMRYFDFARRKTRDVFTLDKDFDRGISISRDGRYILFSQVDEANADIMVMDKYR